MKSKKNLFAALLSLLLIFTFVPVGAVFAAEAEAELYNLEVNAQPDYDVYVWIDGELAAPAANGTTYYIPAGGAVRFEWNEYCYFRSTSNLSDCGFWVSSWDWGPGEGGFTMPARNASISFGHR